jgi:hypothetical protein
MSGVRLELDGSITVLPDTRTLAEAQAERIAQIKAEAGARILSRWPDWMQRNALARGAELAMAQATRGHLTPAEGVDAAALTSMWSAIQAIRKASDAAEAAVMEADTNEEADAVAAAWP